MSEEDIQGEDTVEQTQPEDTAFEAGDAGASTGAAEEAAITSELRRMGERLAAAIRAATDTPEAERLRGEVGDGVRKLRGELEGVLRRGKESTADADPAPVAAETAAADAGGSNDPAGDVGPGRAARVQSTVRHEIAHALRALNGALDRLAGTIAPDNDRDGDDTVV